MRTILLSLLAICYTVLSFSQQSDSIALEQLYQEALLLEQEAFYDSATILYLHLRGEAQKKQKWEIMSRAAYKMGFCMIRAGNYEDARDSLHAAIQLIGTHLDSTHFHIAGCYNELGTASWYLSDYKSAQRYYQKCLDVSRLCPEDNQDRIQAASSNLGLIEMGQGNYEEAIARFQTLILDIQSRERIKIDTLRLGHYWINIATAYDAVGDFSRALQYNLLGLEGHRYYYGPDHPQIGNDLTNIGHVLEQLGRYDEALPYHYKALKIQIKRLESDHPILGNTFLNLGAGYEGLHDYDSATFYYEKAYQIYKASLPPYDADYLLCINNLGGLAREQGLLQKAKEYHELALGEAENNDISGGDVYSATLCYLGMDYWKLGREDSARYYFEKSIEVIRKSSPDRSLEKVVLKPVLLEAYSLYAWAIWDSYHSTAAPSQMQEILSLVDSAQLVLQSARRSAIDAASRMAMIESGSDLMEIGIKAAYVLYAKHRDPAFAAKALVYAEHTKAATLYENLQFVEALNFVGVGEAVRVLEKQLKRNIANLREQLYFQQEAEENNNLLALRTEIERNERRYDSLLTRIEELSPAYYQLQHTVSLASPSDIQAGLPEGAAMLVYSQTEEDLFIWQIEKNNLRFYRSLQPADLSAQVSRFRELLQHPSQPAVAFATVSQSLFQTLIGPLINNFSEDVQSLIIVPDGVLGVFPFEVLTPESGVESYAEMTYLLDQFAISYAYSASVFLEQLSPREQILGNNFGGFAVSYEPGNWEGDDSTFLLKDLARNGNLPLPAAKEEVVRIARILKGNTFLDHEATEAQFKEVAKNYSILHLAMHTLIDDQNPLYSKLIFSASPDSLDDLLTAAELYNLEIPAQLTVLSACNTGYGKIMEGEGVMSLSRAFAYAGCPSTVMSLWKVPDEATRDLMLPFYEGLKSGLSKPEALRKAKQVYLTQIKASERSHPFYWAGFVQMGNPNSIQQEKSVWQRVETGLIAFGDFAWGMPLLVILLLGGAFFLVYSRLLPYRYFKHALRVLQGKYDDPDDPGDINHYQALSTALAATVGMGNISGVAVAITTGGPGAIFWMWLSALLGVATKFFTCTLAVMYRDKDSDGNLQGGPMYVITRGMGQKWKPLAIFFSLAGLIGCLPLFQANQLTQTIQDVLLTPNGIEQSWQTQAGIGLLISILVGTVIFGGIKRIGTVAGRLVPFMVLIYLLAVLFILFANAGEILPSFRLILEDAFTGSAVMGGALGSLIITGVRRAAFSNEAGIGTAPMAHGAARTKEPVREGLIAMLGPLIDTILVCTLTALAIIISGVWQTGSEEGIGVTLQAFETAMPGIGRWLLTLCALVFSLTTLFTYSYYGTKCLGFLTGARYQKYYQYFYVISIIYGAVATLDAALALIDGMYALMTIPTVLSAVYLSPRVYRAAKTYFAKSWD